jgi:hypothetical protein
LLYEFAPIYLNPDARPAEHLQAAVEKEILIVSNGYAHLLWSDFSKDFLMDIKTDSDDFRSLPSVFTGCPAAIVTVSTGVELQAQRKTFVPLSGTRVFSRL